MTTVPEFTRQGVCFHRFRRKKTRDPRTFIPRVLSLWCLRAAAAAAAHQSLHSEGYLYIYRLIFICWNLILILFGDYLLDQHIWCYILLITGWILTIRFTYTFGGILFAICLLLLIIFFWNSKIFFGNSFLLLIDIFWKFIFCGLTYRLSIAQYFWYSYLIFTYLSESYGRGCREHAPA